MLCGSIYRVAVFPVFRYLRPVVLHRLASQIPAVPIAAYLYALVVALFFLPHALYIDEPPGFEPGRYISTTLNQISGWLVFLRFT